ncbi:MAG: T9SS type A sorting domain-containing protein [Ignavibacteria bacterium]|nr:T9SS type A sorting domain-containing protein [Ignavibacteria bacterium]
MTREWVQRYNGPGNSYDIATVVLSAPDHSIVVCGSEVGDGTGTDFIIMKYDRLGNRTWSVSYDGSGSQADQVIKAVADDTGNVYVTGFTTLADGNIAFAVARILKNGLLQWVRILDDESFSFGTGTAICVTASGLIAVAGNMRTTLDNDKIQLALLTPGGNVIEKQIVSDLPLTRAVDLSPGDEGSIIMAFDAELGTSSTDIAVAKYDSSLDRQWLISFNGNGVFSSDWCADLVTDRTGNSYLCGTQQNSLTSSDYFICKISPNGQLIWEKVHSGQYNDIPSSIAIDNTGNCYVTGFSRSGTSIGTEDILTLKISETGSTVWNSVYNGSAGGIDGGNSVTVDSKGNVFVGGYSDRGDVQVTFAMLMLDQFGALRYFDRYSVAGEPEDFAYSVATDDSSVYLTGISIGAGTDYDIATLKYSTAVGIHGQDPATATDFRLEQNYPNPFNPRTTIPYALMTSGFVELEISGIDGRKLFTLENRTVTAGSHNVSFDGSGLPSGIYLCVLKVNGVIFGSRKMTLLK